MIFHIDIGASEKERRKNLRSLIANGDITFAGYKIGKIYGRLSCASGKRMKTKNRVFFQSEEEAAQNGYRPCGHCMKEKYTIWKAQQK